MQIFYDIWKARGLADDEIAAKFAETYPDYPV